MRRWVCGLGVVFVASAVVSNVIYFGSPWFHPYRIFEAVFAALYLTGIFSENHKLHNAIPYLLVSVLVISQLVIRSDIGALMST